MRIGAGTTLGELETDGHVPHVLKEACALAASPQLRAMGTIGGNLLQATRCWYWRLKFPCRLHGGDRCHARDGQHREHAIFANDVCASAHPSDPAAALLALGATVRTSRRELPVAELYRVPTEQDPRTTTLEAGEVIVELEAPVPDASTYLKAMDRKRWSFPQVGVAVARSRRAAQGAHARRAHRRAAGTRRAGRGAGAAVGDVGVEVGLAAVRGVRVAVGDAGRARDAERSQLRSCRRKRRGDAERPGHHRRRTALR